MSEMNGRGQADHIDLTGAIIDLHMNEFCLCVDGICLSLHEPVCPFCEKENEVLLKLVTGYTFCTHCGKRFGFIAGSLGPIKTFSTFRAYDQEGKPE